MKPKIYLFKEHKISPTKVDKDAIYVISKLKQHKHTAYLVGGSVRDLLLKQIPKDFDISTSAKPEEIKRIFKKCFLIGKRFRLAHVHAHKKIIEVATFRACDITSSKLIEHHNVWGNAEEDAQRRDFTINGLFYDPEKQIIIDYVGGFEDAKKKILKTIGDPNLRFIQDPVRMIRLLKFKARFDFNIEKHALQALEESKDEIVKSSQARILEELLRMLQSGSSEKFIKLLKKHGILQKLLPDISNFLEKDEKIYILLKQADIYRLKHYQNILKRSILLSCLVFPILEKDILKRIKKNPNMHLGDVAKYSKKIINSAFSYFFHLSRRIKAEMLSILINQFRFEWSKTIKIPKDPNFSIAMTFFKLRAMYQKNLLDTYLLWRDRKIMKSHKKFKLTKYLSLKKKIH